MLYGLLRIIFTFIYSVIFPTTVKGKENIPKEGAVILAANHLSNWDPPLVGTFIPRHLAYMAKEELFKVPILKNILEQDYDYKSICLQINQGLNYSSKLQLLQILFKISSADTIESSELRLLQTMATLMGISMGDFQSIQAIYSQHQHFHGQVKDTRKELDLAYQILEIDKNASDEEIKKAYPVGQQDRRCP